MAGIADFLRREGWRVSQVPESCPKDFPLNMGVMFLIGRQADQASRGEGGQAPQASGGAEASRTEAAPLPQQAGQASQYCIVWLDPSSRLQVQNLSFSGGLMEAFFGGEEYRLTAEAVRLGGKPHLTGTVLKRRNGKREGRQDQLKSDKDYDTSGTWGAEGNGGGPGGMWLAEIKEEVIAASLDIKNDIKERLTRG